MWIAIITKFFACFKISNARKRLDKYAVYSQHSGALDCFAYFEALRDKHIVYDDNGLNHVVVGAVLEPDGKPLDFVAFKAVAYTRDAGHLQPMFNLIDVAQRYVEVNLERLRLGLPQELYSTDRAALQDLQSRILFRNRTILRRNTATGSITG